MSNAASITLTGRAGTNPQVSNGSTGDRVNLRVVATERRFDRTVQDWVDGDEFGVTVVCWNALASAVLATVRKGDPVIVCGRIATRRYERDGATQYFTEVKADSIGLDLARAGGRFVRAAPDPRENVSPVPTQAAGAGVPGAVEAAAGDELPAEPDDYDDPWGMREQPAHATDELVTTG